VTSFAHQLVVAGAGIELPTAAAAQQRAALLAQESPELMFVQLFDQRAGCCAAAVTGAVMITAAAVGLVQLLLWLAMLMQRL
jgi:hypothetical protein